MFRNFKTQKELKGYVKECINEIGECYSIKESHPDKWDLFIYLFERHYNYPEKFHGLTDIKIKHNPIFKNQLETIIVKANGEEDDVSVLNKCITGKPQNNLCIAMRNAILPQILTFKYNNPQQCVLCQNTSTIHIDHFEPQFEDLKADFLSAWKDELPDKFRQNECHSKVFEPSDIQFENKWFDYHLKNASLRVLCSNCNLTRRKSVKG